MKVPFQNTEIAFRLKPTTELYQAYLLFKLVGSSKLVRWGSTFLNSALKTPLPFEPVLKATLFKQFCGGETAKDCAQSVRKLAKFRVFSILDYSIEGAQSEKTFDATEKELLSTLTLASQSEFIPFSVFKITALVRFSLLEKLHEKAALTEQQKEEWERAQVRIRRVVERAHQLKVKLLIDAEESWIQDPIDAYVEKLMEEFNTQSPTVFQTLQMYRKDRLAYLERLLALSKDKSFFLGLKLVRGAYMEKERNRAESLGYPSPIFADKAGTDLAYNEASRKCFTHLDRVFLFAGTHKNYSTQLIVDLMEEKGLKPNDSRVFFSQPLGMSDNLTFNLAELGFNAAKYIPYGPVRELTPYLVRRAQENSAISGQTLRELELIQQELKRRRSS